MRYIFLFLFVCAGLLGCQQGTPTPVEDVNSSARIGDHIITPEEVAQRAAALSAADQKFAQSDLGKQELLQIIAREKLILLDAYANKLDHQPDYQQFVRAEQERLQKAHQAFAHNLLERMWYEMQTQDGSPAHVTEAEMKDYFAKYPYEMTIKQIIVENAQTADEVLRTLKHSASHWQNMSRQFSIAPSELKTLSFMPGEYLPELEVVAANSPVGKVQGFFKTPLGFHIIMKTGEKRLKWEEAKPRIQTVLENQKIDALLDSLKTKYEVILYDKNE